MTAPRTPSPSPLAGEGRDPGRAKRDPGERGEGASRRVVLSQNPSRASARSAPSPARGEGTERVAKVAKKSKAKFSARKPGRSSAGKSGASLTNPTSRARSLRANMTDAECKLWFALRDRRFVNFKFRRQ